MVGGRSPSMSPSYTIPALARSFDVINIIAGSEGGAAFSEIVGRTGAPKSSIFRILHTLEAASWVEKAGDRYILGYMFIHYGLSALAGRSIADIARPVLESLTDDTGETSHLAVPSGRKSMILEVRESKRHIITASGAGNLLPLYCTSHGKLFLAHNLGDDLEGFYYGETLEKRTPHTITDLDVLLAELDIIRRRGYAEDRQEYHENIWCGAAPVFGPGGDCIGAAGITGTTITCTPDRVPELCGKVRAAAREITVKMGGRPA